MLNLELERSRKKKAEQKAPWAETRNEENMESPQTDAQSGEAGQKNVNSFPTASGMN